MKLLDSIKNNTLIVCSNDNKKIILKELNNYNKLFSINFITINELYNRLFFSYDEKTIYNVVDKYKVKYDTAISYLKNILYVDNKKYNNSKIDNLVYIKEYLNDNNLLIKDEFFIEYIKNKNIFFYGFDYLDKFDNKVITILKEHTSVDIIDKEYNNYTHSVIEFSHIEEEVEYVASSICDLINSGISINNIKLCNINDEYYPSITRYFNMYSIPFDLDNNAYINTTLVGKMFINNYESDLNKTIDKLNNCDKGIVNQIISIVNKYTFTKDKLLVKDMIIHDIANTKVKRNKLKNSIKVIDYNSIISDNDHVFMMNFNQGSIPKIIKDEDYLSNKEKELLNINNSVELTKLIKESTIKNINSIKNLVITYKLESYSSNYFPSNLIDDMKLNVERKDINYSYSVLANKVKLCSYLDRFYKYNVRDKSLPLLYSNYNIPYRTYDNKYNGISFEALNKIINNRFNLSYSSMQSYNECSFKYYINNVLRLDDFEETFSAIVGSLFHHILEIGITSDIDVKEEVNKYISDKSFNNKELFFIDKLIVDIEFALNTIKDNMKYTKFNDIKTENRFIIDKNNKVKVTFVGYIDKMISYKKDNKVYAVLIDYKTYDTDIKLDLREHGLNIQLPIYLYLVSKTVENVVPVGFYVQRILSSDNNYNEDKSLIDRKKDNMKLLGFSTSEEDLLYLFDNSYKDSNVIKGMKIKNDGSFASSANIMSNEEMKYNIDLVDKKIDECIDGIVNTQFDINPKKYKDNNISCTYCKYRDICFMNASNEVEIEGESND